MNRNNSINLWDIKSDNNSAGLSYDLESDSMKNNYIVLQAALYGESHYHWECDEGAYFYNTNYQEPYFIFPIG